MKSKNSSHLKFSEVC